MDAITGRRVLSLHCFRLRTLFANPTASLAAAALLTILCAAAACPASVRVEAYRGEPFGVGRVRVSLPNDDSTTPGGDDRFAVADAEGRVLYPVIEEKRIRRILRRFLGIQLPNRITFYFMFRGDAPLELTVYTPWPQRFTIVPENNREEFRDVMDDWWKVTEKHYERVHRAAEYPIVVENYLTANWSRRLGRSMSDPGMFLFGQKKIGGRWVAQLTGNEAYQAAIERDLVLGRFGAEQVAELPLPEPPLGVAGVERQRAPSTTTAGGSAEPRPQPPAGELPAPGAAIAIEPIAARVPHECFYARFGNYTNYLWFRDFLRHWQGDLGNMVVLRSIDRGLNDRLQEQIAIRDTKIARVVGPTVIRDVAMIGYDFYLRDGPAFGMLFQANNNLLLGRNFNRQRDEALAEHADAKLEMVQIAGQDVSFLSTPDGQLRSYYATDGDFHLITTSRRLVERFYELGGESDGAGSLERGRGRPGSLAASGEFKTARVEMPLARNDTIFLYLSAAFFEHLSSPHYRVELDRRLRSVGEMRVLEMARLAARAEGSAAHSVEELVNADLLPRGFGTRADGSRLIEGEGGFVDSARGVPGWFVPVPDMPVERITRAEAQHYAAFTRSIRSEVGRFVPVLATVARQTSDDGQRDRIVLDARIAPYSQTGMAKWARMLGPDDGLRVAPIAGDVASLEVIVDALGQPIHLFCGLRDFHTPLGVRQGAVAANATLAEYLRGYVGTWPRPFALLDLFLGRPTGPTDNHGIARNDRLFDLWLRRMDDFFLFSFQRDVLLEVGPQLAMIEAERPGQIRLRVDDLTDKQIATGITALGYMRTRAASASASRFMNSLTTQLHVPPAEAREVAERLVGGRFVDPLGGQYVLVDGETALAVGVGPGSESAEHLPTPGGRQLWASTATPPQNRFLLTEIPADYKMPLMDWFRGLTLDAGRYDPLDAVVLHAELDMTHLEFGPSAEEAGGSGFSLPSLGGLLSGWGAKKGDKVEQASHEELPVPAPAKP